MCGITGTFYYRNNGTVDAESLISARNALNHRGPDACGIYVNKTNTVGFGSTRLAIQDLSTAGDQPFVDARLGIAIVFNGEIYNAKSLRKSLEHRGVVFKSSSDTEVLLRLYCEFGQDLLDKLDGIYAFAIWDERAATLFLARDRIGVKPLYYSDLQGAFTFASEPKALLKYKDVPDSINHAAIASYLTFACCPGPDSLFQHIKKVPPATAVVVRRTSDVTFHRYWTPMQARLCETVATMSERECIDLVRNTLEVAVRKQLAGDVPVTCALSGGVDSSAIAALMSQFSSSRMTYFTIGFESEWNHHNEFTFARNIAGQIGADLIELRVTPADVLDFLKSSFAIHCDDPNADPVCGLAFFLAQAMRRRGFKVAMSGEGSDEIFLGYEHYLQDLTMWDRQANIAKDFEFFYWGTAIGFREQELRSLLTDDFFSQFFDASAYRAPIRNAHRECLTMVDEADIPRRLSLIELQIRLPELLLMRVDKMTMANSLECRVPFLDRDLVELSFAVQTNIKLTEGMPKGVLKKAVEGIIPTENIYRKKMGFNLPVSEWLRSTHIGGQFFELLLQSKLMRSGILRREAVLNTIAEHQAGIHDRYFKLWTLLTLSVWYEQWAR